MKWRWLVPTWGDVRFLVTFVVMTLVLQRCREEKTRDYFEKEAVSAGAARYVFDDAGDPHFEWRKP